MMAMLLSSDCMAAEDALFRSIINNSITIFTSTIASCLKESFGSSQDLVKMFGICGGKAILKTFSP